MQSLGQLPPFSLSSENWVSHLVCPACPYSSSVFCKRYVIKEPCWVTSHTVLGQIYHCVEPTRFKMKNEHPNAMMESRGIVLKADWILIENKNTVTCRFKGYIPPSKTVQFMRDTMLWIRWCLLFKIYILHFIHLFWSKSRIAPTLCHFSALHENNFYQSFTSPNFCSSKLLT